MSNVEEYLIRQKYESDTSGLVKGTDKATKSTTGLGSAVDTAKNKLTSFLSPANLVAGAMAYASYRTVQAVKDFVAYEKQLSSLNTIMQVSKTELNAFGDEFINLAIKLGSTKEEITAGAYEALSAGVKQADLVDFMETATKGASAGMTDVATSVDVLTSTLNGFGYASSDATAVMDKLITIQNQGKIKLGELSTVMGDVTGVSNYLGISLDEVGASLSTITLAGTPVNQAGTRMKAMLSELSKEGTTASETFKELTGNSFKNFIAQGGTLQEGLEKLNAHAIKTNKSMIDLWGSIEAGQGAMGLTGSASQSYINNLNAMTESSGELEKAYAIASDNIATDWAKLTARINLSWLKTVTELEQPIRMVIEIVYKVVEAVDSVDFFGNTKKIIQFMNDNNPMAPVIKGMTVVTQDFLEQKRMADEIAKKLENAKYQGTATPSETDNQAKEQLAGRKWLALEEEKVRVASIKSEEDEVARQKQSALEKVARDKAEAEARALHLQTIADQEAKNRDSLVQVDMGIIQDKIDFYNNLNSQFEQGLITREDYDNQVEAMEKATELKQQESYTQQLQNLRDFYLKVGETFKANELEKQILEIELQVKMTTNLEEDEGVVALRDFYTQQEEEQKLFHNNQLVNEWDFYSQLETLTATKNLSTEEQAQREADFRENQRVVMEQYRIQQLEDEMNFMLAQGDMQEEAKAKYGEIVTAKAQLGDQDKKNTDKERYWREYAESKKVDVVQMSADAVLATYTALANGNIKSLAEFKEFAKEQVKAVMLAKGQEAMARSIADFGLGLSYLASFQYSKAGEAFYSSAQNGVIAGILGVASNALGGSSSSSSSEDEAESATTTTTDSDVETSETIAGDSEEAKTQIYVSTSENAMASAMVTLLEKELNDEYNVSIIGNKK